MHTYEHASDLGGCLARPVALRMGYEPMAPPAKMQTVFDAGNKWEAIVIDHLRSRGFVVSDQQLCVYIDVSADVRVACHVDGTISTGLTGEFVLKDNTISNTYFDHTARKVLEVKSMNQDAYDEFVAKGWDASLHNLMPRYKWQVSNYMVALGMELMFVGVNRNSPEDAPEYHVLYAEVPWYSREQIVTQVMLIEAFAKMGQIPTCAKPMYPCPVWYATGCQDADETDEYLEAVAVEIIETKDKIEKLSMRSDKLRKACIAQMGDRTKVRTEAATLSVSKGKVSKYLDEKAMVEDGIELELYRKERIGEPFLSVRKRAQVDEPNDS